MYQGFNIDNNQTCVIKILKPVRTEKIFRETKILQTLFGGPNIVKLYDVVRSGETPCLVFEHIPNVETRQLIPKFSDLDIRLYMFKIL